jgi:hypothetical protein
VAPFGEPDFTMTWVPEHVGIRTSAGKVVAERDNARESFSGHVRDTPWDLLHFAYFHGYTMWTYFAAPFILAEPGYKVKDVTPIVQDGVTLRGISVRFPDSVHSHTQEQRFYFGPTVCWRAMTTRSTSGPLSRPHTSSWTMSRSRA